MNVHKNFSFSAEYLDLSADIAATNTDGSQTTVKSSIVTNSVGLKYHQPSKRWNNIDWLGSVLYSTLKVTAQSSIRKVVIEGDSVDLVVGVRASVYPRIEAQVEVSKGYSEKEWSQELVTATVVYRVIDHFDLALGARNASREPNYNLGFRYSW